MKQGRLFDLFAAVFRRRKNSGPWAEFSQAVRARIEQSVRNGNHLTIVFLDPDARWNGNYCLTDYFSQRILLIISQICINKEIIYLPVEKECALLFEATAEAVESVMTQAAEILRHEDIGLRYKSRGLI